MGFGAVYRISFSLFAFFLFNALMLLGAGRRGDADSGVGGRDDDDLRFASMYRASWPCKGALLLVLLVLSFVVPNGFFDVYAVLARFVSGVFLLMQIVILIDFAYQWNQSWMADGREWKVPVLAVSLAMYAASLTICVFAFKWFSHDDECRNNTFFLAMTIILTFVVSMVSLSNFSEHGALLPSAVVTLYAYYLAVSAMGSDPNPACNALHGNEDDPVETVISIAIAAFSVCYAAWSASTSEVFGAATDDDDDIETAADQEREQVDRQRRRDLEIVANPNLHAGNYDASADDGPEEGTNSKQRGKLRGGYQHGGHGDYEDGADRARLVDATATYGSSHDDDHSDGEPETVVQRVVRQHRSFHLIMAAASMYIAMVLTNWQSNTHSSAAAVNLSSETVWIKILSQWATLLLYLWTLIAPYLFPDRDFSG
eukprot:TRINITY_DN63599_c0_g1_i1.p1 TRINITY_DN63599_c0_g1~~TRINITY_DN63599_c0_g1_i1.p1  ORF type:complete len:428 (+),score=222.09 TRINITY_DN63599_c0_g1_i1:603-1886(+)